MRRDLGPIGDLRRPEELLQENIHASCHFCHEEVFAQLVERAVFITGPLHMPARPEVFRGRTHWRRIASTGSEGHGPEER